MTLTRFEYYAPATIEEAVGLLKTHGAGARVMAGGTDLLIKIRMRALAPSAVVGLRNIRGLDAIAFDRKRGLTIGAMALLADVAAHPAIRKHYPAVAEAAGGTANVQVRNMGTVIGNLCNASPAADNAPTLLALNAGLAIAGPDGERRMPLEQFFKGPGMTALEPAEIVTAVHVPLPSAHSGAAYQSFSARGKLDCTAIGVGALVCLKGQSCEDVRLFIAACAPIPMRAPKAEAALRGKRPTRERIRDAARQASKEALPITDLRASADYRHEMISVVAARVLDAAIESARKRG
jgi:carbon-monoxide dehydrogenase medium subunit